MTDVYGSIYSKISNDDRDAEIITVADDSKSKPNDSVLRIFEKTPRKLLRNPFIQNGVISSDIIKRQKARNRKAFVTPPPGVDKKLWMANTKDFVANVIPGLYSSFGGIRIAGIDDVDFNGYYINGTTHSLEGEFKNSLMNLGRLGYFGDDVEHMLVGIGDYSNEMTDSVGFMDSIDSNWKETKIKIAKSVGAKAASIWGSIPGTSRQKIKEFYTKICLLALNNTDITIGNIGFSLTELVSGAEKKKNKIIDFGNDLVDNAGDAAEEVINTVQDGVNNGVEWAQEMLGKITEAISQLTEAVTSTNAAITYLKNTRTSVQTKFNEVFGTIKANTAKMNALNKRILDGKAGCEKRARHYGISISGIGDWRSDERDIRSHGFNQVTIVPKGAVQDTINRIQSGAKVAIEIKTVERPGSRVSIWVRNIVEKAKDELATAAQSTETSVEAKKILKEAVETAKEAAREAIKSNVSARIDFGCRVLSKAYKIRYDSWKEKYDVAVALITKKYGQFKQILTTITNYINGAKEAIGLANLGIEKLSAEKLKIGNIGGPINEITTKYAVVNGKRYNTVAMNIPVNVHSLRGFLEMGWNIRKTPSTVVASVRNTKTSSGIGIVIATTIGTVIAGVAVYTLVTKLIEWIGNLGDKSSEAKDKDPDDPGGAPDGTDGEPGKLKCVNCGGEVDWDDKICPHCGVSSWIPEGWNDGGFTDGGGFDPLGPTTGGPAADFPNADQGGDMSEGWPAGWDTGFDMPWPGTTESSPYPTEEEFSFDGIMAEDNPSAKLNFDARFGGEEYYVDKDLEYDELTDVFKEDE